MTRAVIYARVSSTMQRDRDTIASQLRVLPEFVAQRGWTLVRSAETYIDDGHTAKAGRLAQRRGLASLLRDAAAGSFDVIVVVDIDRLTRSEDLTERGAILGALQRAGVKIASQISGQVLDLSTSTGDLFTNLHAFFAAEWTRKHRERVMQGRITAIQRGRKPPGKPPWWLSYDKSTAHWSVVPDRGVIVREMFERVVGGDSCRTIADDLHARGIPRPRGEWHRHRVHRIIRSRAALGEWTVDQIRGLVLAVPPVINEALWQRAQLAVQRLGRRGLRKTKHDYLLEAIGVCAQCGAPMGVCSAQWDSRRNGRWNPATYRCRSRRIFRRGGPRCAAPHVRVADADARAWAAIVRELEDPALAAAIAGVREDEDTTRRDWDADAEEYQRRLARLQESESKLLARFTRGTVSEAALDVELARIGRERSVVLEQVAACGRASATAAAASARLRDAGAILSQLRERLPDAPFAVRQALIQRLVRPGGVVFDGRELRITLWLPRSPDAIAADSERRGLVDASVSSSVHETYMRIKLVA